MQRSRHFVNNAVLRSFSVLALALCLVAACAPPVFAATVATDINADVSLNVEVRYTDNTYTQTNAGVIGQTPLNEPADDYPSAAPPVNSKSVQFVRVQTDLTGYVTGKQVQLRVIYRLVTGTAKNSLSSVAVSSGTRNGGTWTTLPFTTVSQTFGQDPATGSAYIDATIQFTVPVESEVLRVYGTFYTSAFTPQSLGDIVGGVQACQFMYLDPVTDQDAADKDAADAIGGSVGNKTDKTDSLIGDISALPKPDFSVDPMQGLDIGWFNSYTNVLLSIVNQPSVKWMLITALSLFAVGYVIFGKE